MFGPNFLEPIFLGPNIFGPIFFGPFFWKLLATRTVQIAEHYNWNNLKESANLFHPKLIFYRGGTKMWKDSIRTTILRIVRFYVRCSAHFFAISFHKLFLASLPPTQTPPLPPTNPPPTLHTPTPPHTQITPHTC